MDLIQKCGLGSAAQRAAGLRSLVRRSQWTHAELAEFLGVSTQTASAYLNPEWKGTLSLSVLRRLASLPDQDSAALSPRMERFHRAAKQLFGRYYYSGVPAFSRFSIVKKLAPLMEMSERNVFRLLPPYDSLKSVSTAAVIGFEQAVQQLSVSETRQVREGLLEDLVKSRQSR
ncbi:MAG: hypothetical protein ACREDR_22060 [Blastocatellia bacterium]